MGYLNASACSHISFSTIKKRIWPFYNLPRVFPNHVVFGENEEGPVDGEAVVLGGDGVVQRHGTGSLRFGLCQGR